MTEQELIEGYKALTQCIDQYIDEFKVEYIVSSLAPSTYKGMINYRDEFGQFLVYDEGDHGYLGKEYNIKFRAVHDHGHYTLGLDFTVKEELELSENHSYLFRSLAKRLGYSDYIADIVYKIIDTEVKEQRLYYDRTKEYVADQRDFVKGILCMK